MTIVLIPEQVDFRISTTDLRVTYTESGGVTLLIDGQTRGDIALDRYREAELHFDTVAELRCTTLNFFEYHGDQVEVRGNATNDDPFAFWEAHGYHPDPGFYQVADSPILQERGSLFDPRKRLGLKHYLVIGYDSYVEVIAASSRMSWTAT